MDPGEETGLALLAYDVDLPATMLSYASPREPELNKELHRMGERAGDLDRLVVVMERFDVNLAKKKVNIEAKQVIGRVLAWSEDRQVRTYWQMNFERTMATRQVLINLGLWLPGRPNRHIMDAVRHGVVHLQRALHMPTLEKGWPRT